MQTKQQNIIAKVTEETTTFVEAGERLISVDEFALYVEDLKESKEGIQSTMLELLTYLDFKEIPDTLQLNELIFWITLTCQVIEKTDVIKLQKAEI